MIQRNKTAFILLLLPLMSLDSGANHRYKIQLLKVENEVLRKEIKLINEKIKVVDAQIRYKDSVDYIKFNYER